MGNAITATQSEKQEALRKVAAYHKKWLDGEPDGIRANYHNVNFANVDLSGMDLREAIFDECRLSHSKMHRTDLTGASLKGVDANDLDAEGSAFIGVDVTNADFSHSSFYGTKWRDAVCNGTIFRETSMANSNLDNANCENADFSYADLRYSSFTGASMHGANFSYVDMTDVDLSKADTMGAIFTEDCNFLTKDGLQLDKFEYLNEEQPQPKNKLFQKIAEALGISRKKPEQLGAAAEESLDEPREDSFQNLYDGFDFAEVDSSAYASTDEGGQAEQIIIPDEEYGNDEIIPDEDYIGKKHIDAADNCDNAPAEIPVEELVEEPEFLADDVSEDEIPDEGDESPAEAEMTEVDEAVVETSDEDGGTPPESEAVEVESDEIATEAIEHTEDELPEGAIDWSAAAPVSVEEFSDNLQEELQEDPETAIAEVSEDAVDEDAYDLGDIETEDEIQETQEVQEVEKIEEPESKKRFRPRNKEPRQKTACPLNLTLEEQRKCIEVWRNRKNRYYAWQHLNEKQREIKWKQYLAKLMQQQAQEQETNIQKQQIPQAAPQTASNAADDAADACCWLMIPLVADSVKLNSSLSSLKLNQALGNDVQAFGGGIFVASNARPSVSGEN